MAHFCAFETKNGTALVNYSYLVDGTKLSALQDSGEGLVYRGPFVYRKNAGSGNSSLTFESAAFGGGRLTPNGAMLYVTDYLGSVRAVVDGTSGAVYKASDYSAFGEENAVIVPQHSIIPSAPLATAALPDGITIRDSYTGKEDQSLDLGTGYIDFGARQYNPSLRRWMTPDPLSEKYYGISPYAFCNNNPVNLVDPDGQKLVFKMNDIEYQWKTVDGEWGFYDQDDKLYMAEEDAFINIVSKYLLDLMSTNIGSTIVNNLVDNDEAVFIAGGRNCYDSNSNTVGFNPYKIDYVPTEGGLNFNAQAIFIHELAHALYDITGGEQKVWFPVQQEIGSKNVMISEIYTTHIENLFRSEVNLPLRTYYAKMFDGTPYGHAIVKSKKGIRYSRYYRSDNTTNFKVIRKKHAYVY